MEKVKNTKYFSKKAKGVTRLNTEKLGEKFKDRIHESRKKIKFWTVWG